MTTVVLGLGIAGWSAARLRHQQGIPVQVADEQDHDTLRVRQQILVDMGIPVVLGQPFTLEAGVSEVIVSPGIAWHHPVLNRARSLGIPVKGEAEVAWESLSHLPWVAITGTNGKTTTTALVAHIFTAAGYEAVACGNIGLPLCQVALETLQGSRHPQWIIAELSSYQIESSPGIHPRIGLWTTFTPDHLERHGTLEHYAAIKASLLRHAGIPILNGDDPYLWSQRQHWPQGQWVKIGVDKHLEGVVSTLDGDTLYRQGSLPLPLGDFARRLPGHHNLQNLLMAVTAATVAGIPDAAIEHSIATFAGVPHRLETVRVLGGIRFINDSKATNYEAALVGLTAITGPVLLIAGGKPKIGDDQAWLEQIRQHVQAVYLIGEAAPAFAQRLQQVGYDDYKIVHTLDQAVTLAYNRAQQIAPCTVLFSPACASFDQYRNFEERGEHFRQCCHALDG
ncbi:MAG: UDP-N-acetylmuramoyl-L-alanine--D-glutamate ligase [Synechococcales cyanobacterium]